MIEIRRKLHPLKLLSGSVLLAVLLTPNAFSRDTASAENFSQALQTAGDMPRLHSLLINHQDDMVVEEYFNGYNARRPANVKSVSKSIMSALVGIAIQQGHIEGLNQPLSEHAGELIPDVSGTGNERITVGNLLSMQAGLETTSFYNYGAWVLSDDWIDFALQQPQLAEPGTRLLYSTGNTHLLSAIITQAAGESTYSFAQKGLAQPLGFQLAEWPRDPNGIYFGGNNMELTPRQMLAFGKLYMNDGRVGDRQILPTDWVETTLQPIAESPREEGRFYGYGWWMREMAGYDTAFAWGYGGQFILLVEELDLVVVTTSSSQPGSDRRQHIRQLYDLLEHEVVSVVGESAKPSQGNMTD